MNEPTPITADADAVEPTTTLTPSMTLEEARVWVTGWVAAMAAFDTEAKRLEDEREAKVA